MTRSDTWDVFNCAEHIHGPIFVENCSCKLVCPSLYEISWWNLWHLVGGTPRAFLNIRVVFPVLGIPTIYRVRQCNRLTIMIRVYIRIKRHYHAETVTRAQVWYGVNVVITNNAFYCELIGQIIYLRLFVFSGVVLLYTCHKHSMSMMMSWHEHTFRVHDDVIKWKHFPRYWPFVRGIHRSPVNSSHKGQWRGALVFSLMCVWIKGWVNNRKAGDVRRYYALDDVSVMCGLFWWNPQTTKW